MAELVVPPVLEQQGRLRRNAPVVEIGDVAPLVHVPANLVDGSSYVVLLLGRGKTLPLVEDQLLVRKQLSAEARTSRLTASRWRAMSMPGRWRSREHRMDDGPRAHVLPFRLNQCQLKAGKTSPAAAGTSANDLIIYAVETETRYAAINEVVQTLELHPSAPSWSSTTAFLNPIECSQPWSSTKAAVCRW